MPGLVPGVREFLAKLKTWMAGTSPVMTAPVFVMRNAVRRHRDAPREAPHRHRLLRLQRVDIDHRQVVGQTVGDIEFLAVGAHLTVPRTLADQDVLLDLLGGDVDYGDAIGRTERNRTRACRPW